MRWSIKGISANVTLWTVGQPIVESIATNDPKNAERHRDSKVPTAEAASMSCNGSLEACLLRHGYKMISLRRGNRVIQQHAFTSVCRREYPDFQAAESSVRRWVAKLRQQTPQAFVPLTADAGELAEADFGKAVVKIHGMPREVHLFVMRLCYSGTPFVRAFLSEKLEAFLEGHRLFDFTSIPFIPKQLILSLADG